MKDLETRPASRGVSLRDEDVETLYSVLRSVTRRGPWEPPEEMRLVSVLGHIVLDFTDAELPPGVTSVDCAVVLGSVEILVPPDVDLELTGSVLLGSVESQGGEARRSRARERRVGDVPDRVEERPLLSVGCSGVLGSVEVTLV